MKKLKLIVNIIGICALLYLTIMGFMGTLPSWIGGIGFLMVIIYNVSTMFGIKAFVIVSEQVKDRDAAITIILKDIQTGDTDKYLQQEGE